jgi:hypothetical protein
VKFLVRLVLVAERKVVGNGKTDVLRRGAMAGAVAGGRNRGRRTGVGDCRLAGEREPSIFRSTVQIRRYPFAVDFAKETLRFLVINPRSQGVKLRIRFCILKTYFQSVNSKIRFQQFTVLPLELF